MLYINSTDEFKPLTPGMLLKDYDNIDSTDLDLLNLKPDMNML